jgi:hypothetical protein
MPIPRRSERPTVDGVPRLPNVVPSVRTAEDFDARAAGALRNDPPPSSLDLTVGHPWWRVRDQKDTGSCVGWALADSVMRWHLVVKEKRLREGQELSPRFIWMASKEYQAHRIAAAQPEVPLLERGWRPSTFLDEASTTAKDALEVARRFGAVTEYVLQFNGPLNQGPEDAFYERAARFKIDAYYRVAYADPNEGRLRYRQWLAQHGPVMIVVQVDRGFFEGDAVLTDFRPLEKSYLHACALVGYDDSGFLIRNSWGRGWGDGGYCRASMTWLRSAVKENYGVVFPSSAASASSAATQGSSSSRDR